MHQNIRLSERDIVNKELNRFASFVRPEVGSRLRWYVDCSVLHKRWTLKSQRKLHLLDFSEKTVLSDMSTMLSVADSIWEDLFERALKYINRGQTIHLYIDDVQQEKEGKKVANASVIHCNPRGGLHLANCLVDCMLVCGDLHYFTGFEFWIPKKKTVEMGANYLKKTELGRKLIDEVVDRLRSQFPNITVWVGSDTWYTSEETRQYYNNLDVNYSLQLKSNMQILLGKESYNISAYFADKTFKKRSINDETVYFAESTLMFKNFGRMRVIAVRFENDKINYYITKKRKCKAETLIKHRTKLLQSFVVVQNIS